MVCVQRGGSVTTYRAGGRTVFRVTVPLARVPTGSDA
jgi:hypothetical protein